MATGDWRLATAAATAAATLSAAGVATAQPTATDPELQAYANMFWHIVDTGTPHPDAALFEFADPLMNASGSFPFAGALALFANIYDSKLNPDGMDCENYKDIFRLLEEDADVATKFWIYTTSKSFSTSDADPEVNEKHFWAIIDAVTTADGYVLDGSVSLTGESLTSNALKLAQQSGSPNSGLLLDLPENATFEAVLSAAVDALHTANSPSQIDPLGVIRGTQPVITANAELESLLHAAGMPCTVDPVFVAVGDFGMLTFMRVDYLEKVYIADIETGSAYGPYVLEPDLPILDALLGRPDHYKGGMTSSVLASKSSSACEPIAQVPSPGSPLPYPVGPLPPVPPTPGLVPGVLPPFPGPWWPNPNKPTTTQCRTIPATGVSPATCICTITAHYRRPVPRCILGCLISWTGTQHAKEIWTCSGIGPCAALGLPPGPGFTCPNVVHQIDP